MIIQDLIPETIRRLKALLKSYPEVKLAYLFGSRVRASASPLSDYDFALYLDTTNKIRINEIRLELYDKISRILKKDAIDIVILNTLDMPELKYQIITEGKLLFERKPFKVLVEPLILNEYFDFNNMLLRYNLTRE